MAEPTEPLLSHLVAVAQRIRANDDRLSHPEDVPGGDTFMGVPILTSANVSRSAVWSLGGTIALHPFTAHAVGVALTTGRRIDALSVQRETADWWVQQRIDRMARAATDGVDRLTFAYNAQAVVEHQTRWCEQMGERHHYDWVTLEDYIRDVLTCPTCGHQATAEAVVRSGWAR